MANEQHGIIEIGRRCEMANLDPQVQIKLIEISKEWTQKTHPNTDSFSIPKAYPKTFDEIYVQLVKTVSEK